MFSDFNYFHHFSFKLLRFNSEIDQILLNVLLNINAVLLWDVQGLNFFASNTLFDLCSH